MATVEKRKYEESEEPEEIDEFYTDRDTIMGNSTPEFVKHEGEEPGKRKGAGGGGAPFRTPHLVPVDALAYLGLYRDSAHGDNAKDETQEHQTSLSDVPQPTAPGPGKDVQHAPQDQQLSGITCKITQHATIPAAVVRLVLSPIGYNINVTPLHLTTQVQANPYKDAEENAKRTDCPNHTSLEAEQILQPATQPPVEQWPTEAPELLLMTKTGV